MPLFAWDSFYEVAGSWRRWVSGRLQSLDSA